MSLFKDMLKADESLIKNELALDYDFLPKILPHREEQQRTIAASIQPLLQGRNGSHLFVHGAPGIGKTAATKSVLRDLEEEADGIIPVYINCWQKNTSFKVICEMCEQLDYRLTHNKRTEELFAIVQNILNKKAAVFVFDEVDKLEDFDFLYSVLENIYKKSIILITNHKSWLSDLDQRVRSRMLPDMLEFQPYNTAETYDILKQRIQYGLQPNVLADDAFDLIASKTAAAKDIRTGLHLIRDAALAAEAKSSRNITKEHAETAIAKLDTFTIKKSTDLSDEEQAVLSIIKKHSNKKIGDLYLLYKEAGGTFVYKSFQRKVDKLTKSGFLSVKKLAGGKDGNTTIVSYANKKLTDFS